MRGRFYRIPIDAVASPAAAFDPWEVNVAAAKFCMIRGINLGQSSDAGDAQDEQLQIKIVSGYSTSGSGGSSATPVAQPGASAFGGTAETMNTTVATGGSPVVEWASAFNVRAGHVWLPEEFDHLLFLASARIVVRISAPADAVTISGTLDIEELG